MKVILTITLLFLTLLSVFLPYLLLFPLWGIPDLSPQEIGIIPLWGQVTASFLFWFLFFLNVLERKNFPEKKIQNWGLVGLICYGISALLFSLNAGGLQAFNPLVWGIVIASLTGLTCLCALLQKGSRARGSGVPHQR